VICSQYFFSASGCGSSDVSVRSESEQLSLLLLSTADSLPLLSVANVNSQQLHIFAINKKAFPHSVNTSNKCSYLFPLFPQFTESLSWRTDSRYVVQAIIQLQLTIWGTFMYTKSEFGKRKDSWDGYRTIWESNHNMARNFCFSLLTQWLKVGLVLGMSCPSSGIIGVCHKVS
jgi:hypothetical protein